MNNVVCQSHIPFYTNSSYVCTCMYIVWLALKREGGKPGKREVVGSISVLVGFKIGVSKLGSYKTWLSLQWKTQEGIDNLFCGSCRA